MNDEFELMRGGDNPFRDAGLPDPDTKLMKADLAAGILRILRERALSATAAARLAEVAIADLSRIRKADLGRFTIDRLVNIHNRLDRSTRIRVALSRSHEDGQGVCWIHDR
jgi:predicted XRE-type DNA-binding protein